MKAVEFPEQNEILAKDQPQYQQLPVHIGNTEETPFTACMELDDEEIEELVRTRRIWHTQFTFGTQYHPIRMSTKNPFQ